MQDLNSAFWLQVAIYAASFGTFAGTIIVRLSVVEKKVSEYHKVNERLALNEASIKSAHKRIDNINREV